MDIDSFPEIAELLEIKHVPEVYMIYKGDLIDLFGGVPKDPTRIMNFFSKAQ